MGYKRLYKNLIDIIKEEQAKLGFRRESIRLYYPLSSLNHFFETQDTEEQMKNRLHGIPDFIKETLGDIKVTSKKERFCASGCVGEGRGYAKGWRGGNPHFNRLTISLMTVC